MPVLAPRPEEYRAAREAAALVDLSAREVVRLVGPERQSFLQGMVSNEVEKLRPGQSCEATALTPKGAMVAFLRVHAREQELLLDVPQGAGATVKAFLEKFLISEDAEVQAAGDVAVVGLLGPKADEWLAKLPAALQLALAPGLLQEGRDVLVPRAELAQVFAALAELPRVSEPTWDVLRVEAGVPKWGAELLETTIPLEANLERAIHFSKGCYIGQEVIARASARGSMNKRLVGFLLADASPEAGTELRVGERKVGWLTSVVQSPRAGQYVALGYLHRDFLQPGFSVPLPSGGNAVMAALPFLPVSR